MKKRELWAVVAALMLTCLFLGLVVFPEAVRQKVEQAETRCYWIVHEDAYECSRCAFFAPDNYHYCPNCGARRYGVFDWGY